MRKGLVVLWMLLCPAAAAQAQISIGIGLPHVSIGINLPVYPQLVPVPGYPVYYAPQLNSNYFFYDGMYWVYQDDNWYASSWYNGPWGMVAPEVVPLFVLRIPVRYYRHAPSYFRGWRQDAPPRWGEHWGNDWSRQRGGWDRWDRKAVPVRPPLPVYQKNYSGDRYPRAEQQHELQSRNYRYQPREPVVRQHYETQRSQTAPGPRGTQAAPQQRSPGQQDRQRSAPPAPPQPERSVAPRAQPQQQGGAPRPQQGQPSRQDDNQHPRGEDRGGQGRGAAQEPRQGPGQERERDKGGDRRDERGR